jgi:hypothetical protein
LNRIVDAFAMNATSLPSSAGHVSRLLPKADRPTSTRRFAATVLHAKTYFKNGPAVLCFSELICYTVAWEALIWLAEFAPPTRGSW